MPNASNIIVCSASISLDGGGGAVDIGYTIGGTTVRYEPEVREVYADQAVGVVRKARTSERMYVTTTMLEVTLVQLRRAFMLPAANYSSGTSTLYLGYNNACWTEEFKMVLTGVGPGCGTRTFTFERVTTLNEKEYNMTREEETAFEVEFECLKTQVAGQNGRFGTIVDS